MASSMTSYFHCLLLIRLVVEVAGGSIFEQTSKGRCQPIDIPLCSDIPYNYTFYPNTFLQKDQQSLQTETEHFKPLIRTKCHPQIKFFVCSVFAPMCPEAVPQAVTSCRSVCEEVKADCKSILDEFGIAWPEPLECSRFPQHPDLCMKPPVENHHGHHDSSDRRVSHPLSAISCPPDLLNIDPTDVNGACAIQCEGNVMFRESDKKETSKWMGILGSADLFISTFTFLTFLIERHRFRFPERCVFYMALCFVFFSIPHLFPFFWTFEQRACDKIPTGQSFLVYAGLENTQCLLSFTLTYYFSTAASLWWLMFAFTWYLSAGRKWVPEGIEACSAYVHLVAWGVSALMTIIVMISHRVDASELTGICSVGNMDPFALLFLSLLPRAVITLLGVVFVVAGFSSMCREERSFRRRGTDTSKLEKLMAKMGAFCVLYIVPALTLIVCEYLHYNELEQWSKATILCKRFGGVESGACSRPPTPPSLRYLLSLCMSLSGGVACAMWILSPKTFVTWQRFICCGMCSSAPSKPSQTVTRPLLEPPVPMAPPPQPPAHYAPLHSGHAWRPSHVV